jgi:ribonuclease P protein subunit RPR2
MKKSHKDLAMQRIETLVRNALETARTDPVLAQKQAKLAKRISTKFRVRLPYEIRQLYCKKCKLFIIPGKTARVRVGRTNVKAIRITCLNCGHVYRKVIK